MTIYVNYPNMFTFTPKIRVNVIKYLLGHFIYAFKFRGKSKLNNTDFRHQ